MPLNPRFGAALLVNALFATSSNPLPLSTLLHQVDAQPDHNGTSLPSIYSWRNAVEGQGLHAPSDEDACPAAQGGTTPGSSKTLQRKDRVGGISKRQRVTVEEIPDEGGPDKAVESFPPFLPTLLAVAEDDTDAHRSRVSNQSNYCLSDCLKSFNGVYLEQFPEPLVGAPVSNKHVPPQDLESYMKSCGPMAKLEHFEVAELLMTSGMTNAAKDQHLKSRMYKNQTPWPDCDSMLSNVDKLAHGPDFHLDKINVFNGQGLRQHYMVLQDIISITQEFLLDASFKNHIQYKPCRIYTLAKKTECVYGKMYSSDWYWNQTENLVQEGKQNATVLGMIVATNQTTVSMICGGQKVYPVYVLFGNLDKAWQRKPSKHGMYLLGYLPIKLFEDIANNNKRQQLKMELVHQAMEKMFLLKYLVMSPNCTLNNQL
ncbi:hypothetical protein RhiTH_011622 [Rhizoctonia solani]